MRLEDLPQLPTVSQCAPVIGVEKSTLYEWIRNGTFPREIVRDVNGTMRIAKRDLEDWFAGKWEAA